MADAGFAHAVPPLHYSLRLVWVSYDGLGATWIVGYVSGASMYVYCLTLWGFYATGLRQWAPANRGATSPFPVPVANAYLVLLHTTSTAIGGSWRLGYTWRETMFVYQLVLWDRIRFDLDDEDDDDDDHHDMDDAETTRTTALTVGPIPRIADSDVEATAAEMYAGADSESTSCSED